MATILSLNNDLDQALRDLGHTVISISLRKSDCYSAQKLWEESSLYPTPPDLFIQKESIGLKILLRNVSSLPCKTAFWGIDTHLHYAWQMYYARLFDVFFTPHKDFLAYLCEEWQHPQLIRLAQSGVVRDFVPHAQREHKLNFVARLSGTRIHRQRLCQLLWDNYKVQHTDNLTSSQMFDLYSNTRIIPNESIAKEVNFRLLEGASVGACVITPDVGDDQNCLFTPNKEILVYKNLEELKTLIDKCLAEPDFCENIGRKAFERVQKEHTPLHRAQQLCAAFHPQTPSTRETTYAEDLTHFSLFLTMLGHKDFAENILTFPAYEYQIPHLSLIQEIFCSLRTHENNKEGNKENIFALIQKASLCLMKKNLPLENMAPPLASYEKMLAIACAGAALYYEDASLSYFFLRLHQKACSLPMPPLPSKDTGLSTQDMVIETAINWIHVLLHVGKECLSGERETPGLCRTALDFINIIQTLYPTDMRWYASMLQLKKIWQIFPEEERAQLEKELQAP